VRLVASIMAIQFRCPNCTCKILVETLELEGATYGHDLLPVWRSRRPTLSFVRSFFLHEPRPKCRGVRRSGLLQGMPGPRPTRDEISIVVLFSDAGSPVHRISNNRLPLTGGKGNVLDQFGCGRLPAARPDAEIGLLIPREFAYDLQALKRVTIVGERTGGGAPGTTSNRITDRLSASIPFCWSINPLTKTTWEGAGVQPDVAVPAN
jgi:hypothetical protein